MLRRFPLWQWILFGMVLGAAAGAGLAALPEGSGLRAFSLELASTVGEIFVRLITLVMVPLVIASLVVGISTLGDPKKLGRIGLRAFLFFFCSTAVAVSLGLGAANVIRPGERLAPERAAELQQLYASEAEAKKNTAADVKRSWSIFELLKSVVAKNPIDAAAKGEMLPVITFAMLLGIAAVLLPEEKNRAFLAFMASLNEVMLKMVEVVMWTAPVGVAALMTKVILASGLGILATLAFYGLTVVLGLAIHGLAVYPLAVRLFTPVRAFDFLRALREVHLTAFSTSSSAATLAVNLKACEERLSVPPRIAGFVLPLGATLNMDGTALYQGVAAVFIAQVYGIDLDLPAQLSMVLTATLASIGAAPVPGAGMVMLAVIMAPLGIPLEGLALIFGIDRLLDMCRTVVNVTGDAACTVIVAAREGEPVRYRAEA